jgi:regulatory protein
MNDRNNDSILDFGQSFRKAADYCAIQDRCNSEIRYKLKYWNIDSSFVDDIIDKLIDEDFLDEKRFAINFAGGKFRMNGWGKIKIASELRFRSVPANLIQVALSTIDTEEYTLYLGTILQKKLQQLGSSSPANQQKATFFAASRGFEPGLISSMLKNNELPDL